MKKLEMALCAGRHEIEVKDGYIFETIKDVTNIKALEQKAFAMLWGAAYRNKYTTPSEEDGDQLYIADGVSLDLYVTGLTVALIAVLNVCREEGIDVTLWHYNRDSGKYYPQPVK